MQRSPAAVKATHLCAKIKNRIKTESPDFDVFISHRGIDTRRSVAGILHEHFSGLGLWPFLDVKSMSPGDNLIGKIDSAIRSCRVGVPVFSPRYCESYYCLYELARMLRSNKWIVPIFWNVKPSELRVADENKRLSRFAWAVEEAKCTVGLSFDSTNGDWSELLSSVSGAVMKLVEEDER
ncbi:toll/interleukin-1 receptor-like protein [Cucurbita moschata]|uniref:Toll/interleukin-1 receptor-like protein n=1 Tax=Cucurbita moschata TaxID=3662 RepID=A0A6J1GEQ2_CUCMO|nr:toll/interleukin-1 receptor-like protein [Cucurbita moschata]